jgi:glycosyltransferase involved in cell wall biosynthesis
MELSSLEQSATRAHAMVANVCAEMPHALPAEIARLSRVVRAISTLTDTNAIMQHVASFREAHAVLKAERDADRRLEYLNAIQRLLPAAGLGRVFVLSFLIAASEDAQYLCELEETLSRPDFTPEQRHFFYWQLLVRHPHIRGAAAPLGSAVYASLLASLRDALGITAGWIEPANRDAGSIVVITNQLLDARHQPTADCLDYCHVLQTQLEKKVLLINTGDMPWTLELPYYDAIRFNHIEEYAKIGRLTFEGELIDFHQCRKPMPNLDETRAIVKTVLARKPAFVLSLGHSNVAADLCSEFLTVATMPFGTNLSRARSNLFILPRKRRPDDEGFMREWRITAAQIIETAEYMYRLPARTASLTRADLGLPPDAYVIAIVGNRLDEEITDALAVELAGVLSDVPQAFLAFVGLFPGYSRLALQHAVLGTRSTFLGYQNDVLAVYECCDAYLNPPRYGGASSAAYALAMGLPVLTLNTGDTANSAGPRFVFDSFDEIKQFIARTLVDPVHRSEWAAMARARFTEISDRRAMLRTIVEQVAAKADLRIRV